MHAGLPTRCFRLALVTTVAFVWLPPPAAVHAQALGFGSPAPRLAWPDTPVPASAASPGDVLTAIPGQASPTLADVRRELRTGDDVFIVRATGESLRGRVLRIGETDLDVRAESVQPPSQPRARLDLTIPLDAIRSLERTKDPVRNGTLIGAGIGAGFGLAMLAHAVAVDRNEMDEWAAGYAIGIVVTTGIGALAGWAVDAAHSRPSFRYEAPAATGTRVQVLPLLSRGTGLAVGISF